MLAYGKTVAYELLQNPKMVKRVILREGFDDKTIFSLLENSSFKVEYLDKLRFSKVAEGNHQGIIVDIEDFPYQSLEEVFKKDPSFVLILDHLEDPHNLGAIVRTAEAAGVDAIILPKNRSVSVTPTVMKTSAGAIFHVPISLVTNLHQSIESLKKNGFWIVGTDMENSQDYRSIPYDGKIALVIGSEGFGMSRLVRSSCDFIARIPMYGKVNSLNASVASAIMIYEVVRNRK